MGARDLVYELHYLYAKASKGKPSSREDVDQFIFGLLDKTEGLALGEYHGAYAYPMYVEQNAKEFAARGVTAFIGEIFPRAKQHLIDAWQDRGDARPVIDFLNARKLANSSYQFEHYWKMCQALNRAGIRIHGSAHTTNDQADFSMRDANQTMLDTIKRVRAHSKPGEKYLVYGGQGHFRYLCDGEEGIAYKLGIPVVQMDDGPYLVAEKSVSDLEHIVQIPRAEHQIAYFRGPVTKHRIIDYPEQSPG